MIAKSIRYALGFVGLAGSLAFIAAAPVHAQQQQSGGNDLVNITGGRASFTNTKIFVPNSSGTTRVYGYGDNLIQDGSLFITTSQGDIPTPILFKPGTVPTLNTAPGGTPAVGNTGSVEGNISFRAFSSNGQPALFVGVPTKLDFTVTAVNSTGNNFNSTLFATPPNYTLITSGGVVTSGNSVQTGSATTVFIFQVQNQGQDAQDTTYKGTTIPASDFTVQVEGKSYPADLDVDLTGDFVTIPTSIGFSATGSSTNTSNNSNSSNSNNSGNNNTDTNFVSSNTTFIPNFEGNGNNGNLENVFSTEFTPTSGDPINVGSDDTGSGQVYQVGNNYYVTVGLSSRVWPGLIGVTPTSNSNGTNSNGTGTNSTGTNNNTNGTGTNGTGTNGTGTNNNGTGTNGTGTNGTGTNGTGTNGTGTNGTGTNGTNNNTNGTGTNSTNTNTNTDSTGTNTNTNSTGTNTNTDGTGTNTNTDGTGTNTNTNSTDTNTNTNSTDTNTNTDSTGTNTNTDSTGTNTNTNSTDTNTNTDSTGTNTNTNTNTDSTGTNTNTDGTGTNTNTDGTNP